MTEPNFLQDRENYRTFEEVVEWIHTHYIVTSHSFRVGEKHNTDTENQRACCVLAYAIRMQYTFEETKALFGEHDHLCLALPHLKKDRNILQLNNIYRSLLQQGQDPDIRVCDYPDLISIPQDVLTLKSTPHD